MEAQNAEFPPAPVPDLFVAAMGDKATAKAIDIVKDMRAEGFSAIMDTNQRSLRAQLKYADKLGAKYSVIIGDNEVDNGVTQLKNMETGEQQEIELNMFVSGFYNITLSDQLEDIEINGEELDFASLLGLNKNEQQGEE